MLSWLLAHKAKGYFVFGLEQTSSSVSLSEMEFPDRPTVLLLGKEKEGIPVEYLQAVDQCVELKRHVYLLGEYRDVQREPAVAFRRLLHLDGCSRDSQLATESHGSAPSLHGQSLFRD